MSINKPLTRKEIFMNAVAEGKPADLKPLTREEMLLQKHATPASSGADWNASEGEPGHVLNRTHYVKGMEQKTLLDVTVSVSGNQFMMSGIVPIVVGNTYTVTWDGTEYECVATEADYMGVTAPALGNYYFVGGENNGMPFAFISVEAMEGIGGAAMQNGDHTLKIVGEMPAYQVIDECYLPTSCRSMIVKTVSAYVDSADGSINFHNSIIGAALNPIVECLWNGGRLILDFSELGLLTDGTHRRAEVTEWYLEHSNATYFLQVFFTYDGKNHSFWYEGQLWTPPAT